MIITVVLVLLSVIYLKVADKFNIIDKPNHRSSHTVPTIRGGGALFLFGLWIFFFISNFSYPYLVLGTSLIAIVSFVDDIKTLSSKVRFPFQFLAIVLCMYQLEVFDMSVWITAVVLIVGLGFVNFYNFMDGINGITGLYSLVVISGLYMVNKDVQVVDQDLLIILIISLCVFGYYNFRKKARCFAGDVGSISIAVIIFFISTALFFKLNAPVIILFGVVYGGDAILTLLYRKSIGEKLTEPHRLHIYQKLVDIQKIPHLYVSSLFALIQLIVNCIVLYTYKSSFETQLVLFIAVVLFIVSLYGIVFKLMKNKQSELEIH